MNQERRKRLNEAMGLLDRASDIVDGVLSDEQYAYDNLPENFQDSEQGDAMEDALDCLDSARSELDSAVSYIGQAMN